MSRHPSLICAAALVAASAFTPTFAQAETIAITNAHLQTAGAGGDIASGTIVIKDGRIAAVGAGVSAPAGARVIDARGQVVTPGFIAPSTNLLVTEVDLIPGEPRDDQPGQRLGAAFDIQYGVNPNSAVAPIARQSGITRAVATPVSPRSFGGDQDEGVESMTAGGGEGARGGDGLFAGQAAGVRLASGDMDPVFKPKAAMVVDLGSAGARAAGSRGASIVLIRSAFEAARHYARNRSAYDKGASRPYSLSREDLEALGPVVEGRMPLLVRVHRASDIHQVLKLAREENVKVILEGAEEGWMVAGELASAHVPVLIDPQDDLPSQFESLGSRLDNAARLQAAGVTIAIEGSRDFNNLRQARFNAGTAVANGLAPEAALKAITVNPARIFGLGEVGTLEVGKEADVVLWSGDPFETTSFPVAIFIGGKEQPNTSRALELRDRYLKAADGFPPAYH